MGEPLALPQGGTAWTFPAGRIGPLHIRLHTVVPLWIVAEFAVWAQAGWFTQSRFPWPVHLAACTLSLLLVALVHELGRAVWRRIGAGRDAPEEPTIILWPIGGLTPPERVVCARPILAEAGGFLTVVGIAGAAFGLSWLSGVPLAPALSEPLWPVAIAQQLTLPHQVAAFWTLHAAAIIAILNLIPAPAFDLGRMLELGLTRRLGWFEGGILAARTGLIASICIMTVAAIHGDTRIMAVAAVGAIASVVMQRRIVFRAALDHQVTEPAVAAGSGADEVAPTDVLPAAESPPPAGDIRPTNIHAAGRDSTGRPRRGDTATPGTRSAPAPRQPGGKDRAGQSESTPVDEAQPGDAAPGSDAEDAAALDAVLAKISREGRDSLSDDDREVLRRATERRRRG